MDVGELRTLFDDLPQPYSDADISELIVYPVSCNWPQGFSWSPFIAQEKLLDTAAEAGFDSTRLLAPNTHLRGIFDMALPPSCLYMMTLFIVRGPRHKAGLNWMCLTRFIYLMVS